VYTHHSGEAFGAKRAVGYEIREKLYKATLSKVAHRGLKDRIRVVNGDMFKADLSETTVITLYLTSLANEKLKPKLEKEAKLGTRAVSHGFEIPRWQETQKESFHSDIIYLYIIPDAFQAMTKKN
jgi:hypothetical protein